MYFIGLDGDGDNILLENSADLFVIIQMNKKKCMEGKAITLSVIDSSQIVTARD